METKREGTYELDELTLDDILYQIYRIREWFLYLTKDEHLSRTAKTVGRAWGSTLRLSTHHLGNLLLVFVLLLLLTRIRWGSCRLLSWCHNLWVSPQCVRHQWMTSTDGRSCDFFT